MITVDVKESKDLVEKMIKRFGWTMPVLLDSDGVVADGFAPHMEGLYPIQPEFIDAFIGTCEYCGKLQRQGKVKLFAPFASFNGGVTILDVDSHDEAMQVIAGTPLLPFVEMEVIPLVTDEVALATAKAMKDAISQKERMGQFSAGTCREVICS